MVHLEVVSLDGAVKEESHRGIGLHKEEEEEGVHCVYMYVCMYINIWNSVCHQWHCMRITREEISVNNPDRELGSRFVTSRTQPMLIGFNSSL